MANLLADWFTFNQTVDLLSGKERDASTAFENIYRDVFVSETTDPLSLLMFY